MSFTDCKIMGAEVDPDAYHRFDQKPGDSSYPVSSSMLKLFNRCAARWRNGYESPESKATRFGSLLDCLALTPGALKSRFAIQPDKYTTSAMECPSCHSVTDSKRCRACGVDRVEVQIEKEWSRNSATCTEWAEDHKHLTVATSDELNYALAAARALQADARISSMLADSDKQVWLAGFWKDETTGLLIPVRALLDFVPRPDSAFYKNLGDLKTARNAAPGAWGRAVFDMGYHVQAAFNLDLYRAARPDEDRCNFCHIVVENYPPFQFGRRILSEQFLEIGRATYRRALANYAYCLKNNHWPDYDEGDDSAQGWTITEPTPWMENEGLYAQRFGAVPVEPEIEEDENGDVPTP
jgi:hypothetical protein